MKIAYIVPYIPNQIRVRSYNLIAHLSSLGVDVTVFTVGSGAGDLNDANALRSKCRDLHYFVQHPWLSLLNSLKALPSYQPLQSVYSWHPGLLDCLTHLMKQETVSDRFDLIHVEHLRGSKYGVEFKSRFPNHPLVWDSVDCISHLFRQASNQSRSLFGKLVTRLELERTRQAEGRLICLFDHVLVTSKVDKNALLGLASGTNKPSPISVLPNGVDLDYFQPNPDVHSDPNTLVFSGKMSYHANISMADYLAKEIMPKIWQKRPDIRLVIVGKDPPGKIRKLAQNPLIVVTGTVEDVRPFLWKASAAVVPLVYGTGIQNKILEAMASGTPVITTPRARSSLHVSPGKDILIADDPDGFSSAVLRLIENPGLQRDLKVNGLNYVKRFHNWRNIALQLMHVYEHTIANMRN